MCNFIAIATLALRAGFCRHLVFLLADAHAPVRARYVLCRGSSYRRIN